jgi:hypothetical protein
MLVLKPKHVDNIIAALEHRDRVSAIHIFLIQGLALRNLVAAMQEPLPALTDLYLGSTQIEMTKLPETFLGGCAPRLRSFCLGSIPFPAFPEFVLGCTKLVQLNLFDIWSAGYISSEAMATCLAALPNLGSLSIRFRSPLFRPLQIPPPLTRAVLPALTNLHFCAVGEYFEDFLSRLDIPLLNLLSTEYFVNPVFDLPQLHNFIGRTEALGSFNQANVEFSSGSIKIILGTPTRIELSISCEKVGHQLSRLAQLCSQYLPLLSLVEQLSVREIHRSPLDWRNVVMDASKWLELFHPFVAVHNLHISKQLVPFVAAALQELTGERTMEVLPELVNLFLQELPPSGSVQDTVRSFTSARQLSGHPVAIHSPSWQEQA